MGAQGVGALGVMEPDALIIQAEQKLINQADELVLMVDSTKFQRRSSLILCPLDRVSTLITDDGIPDAAGHDRECGHQTDRRRTSAGNRGIPLGRLNETVRRE